MSSSSREYSPDWLRNVEAPPTTSIWALSSSSSSDAAAADDDDDQLPISSVVRKSPKEPKTWEEEAEEEHEAQLPKVEEEETSASRLQENDDHKVLETTDKKQQTGPYISSSRLPLLLADKVQRSKVLVECEGESIDLSGDLGSVGRVVISDSPSGNQDMLLDLKGTIYKTTILPSRTFCVVSFGQSEAKIEAMMNDFIQLKPQSNVYEAETMVEGTLEGFSFDSEDEGDKHAAQRQTDENEGGEPQSNGKSKGKSETTKKKGKTAVKKPVAKKVTKKKAPVAKKTKAKK
ncbi:putative DNA-binding protein BIN4 [Helianthus annuus]|nr:putative DNA-binding protein BIN4 [Helianthus annuus]